MKEQYSKIIWKMGEFDFIYSNNRKVYNELFDIAKSEILKFEEKHNCEIEMYFNHENNELTIYGCSPEDYKTQMEAHHFSDFLNNHLEQTKKNLPKL